MVAAVTYALVVVLILFILVSVVNIVVDLVQERLYMSRLHRQLDTIEELCRDCKRILDTPPVQLAPMSASLNDLPGGPGSIPVVMYRASPSDVAPAMDLVERQQAGPAGAPDE